MPDSPAIAAQHLSRSTVVLAAAAAALGWGSRWATLPLRLHDHDSVNFASALAHFDLARHSPHLPGYPVYVALARLARNLGAPVEAALAWPALLAAGMAAALLLYGAAREVGRAAAVGLALLYLALPDVALADARPLSDGLGLHLLTMALTCGVAALRPAAAPAWGRAAVAVAGLLLGVRLSSWPLAGGLMLWLGAAAAPSERRVLATVALVAVAAWVMPLAVAAGGPGELWRLGWLFAQGHFRDWHGDPAAALAWPARLALWGQHAYHGGLALAGGAALGLAWAGRSRPFDRRWLGLALLVAAYAVWMALGQNPQRPRHLLPLWPPLLLLGAVALGQVGRLRWAPQTMAWTVAAVAVLGAGQTSLDRLAVQRQWPSPDVACGEWLSTQPADKTLVLGGSEVGVLRAVAPGVRALRVAAPGDLAQILKGPLGRAPHLFVTSRAAGLANVAGGSLQPVKTFPARAGIDLPGQALTVFRWVPGAALTLAAQEVLQ
ncbi:MAG: hypothetical protein HY902_18850 [Deltaproteobacteria bacterium]|nr:hypothetical protein [Deltaproteobacteria bacterium]